jgi:hypothetical protein
VHRFMARDGSVQPERDRERVTEREHERLRRSEPPYGAGYEARMAGRVAGGAGPADAPGKPSAGRGRH